MKNLKYRISCALIGFSVTSIIFAAHFQSGRAQSDSATNLIIQPATVEKQIANGNLPVQEGEIVYQVAPLKALLEGVLEGDTAIVEILRHGDFGIGAVNPLDGEVLMFDGKIWKVTVDGKAKQLSPTDKTPFMTVTFFDADKEIRLASVKGFADLGKQLDQKIGSLNLIHAVRISGEFEYLRVRSVPAQKRPFPRLTEVLKQQAFYEHRKVRGTIVGFRMPAFVNGVNVPGYHFHFITANEKKGGHVLDIKASNITALVDTSSKLMLDLQETDDFLKADLTRQESNELQNLVQPKTPPK